MRVAAAARLLRSFRRTRLLAPLGAALLAAACGGADPATSDGSTADNDGGATGIGTKSIVATSPQVGGALAAPFDMSVIAIHMALQPDGRMLYYGSDLDGTQTAAYRYGVWDPSLGTGTNSVMVLPNGTGTDIFCSSQTLLTDGRTAIFGGDMPDAANTANDQSTIFNGTTNSMSKGNRMNRLRWYSSTTTLMNGEIYVQGGSGGQDRPEIRQADGTFRLLSGVDTSGLNASFPKNWIGPDGKIFGIDLNGNYYRIDPTASAGAGAITRIGQLPAGQGGGGTWSATAMFAPGRVLQLSGTTTAATVVDFRSATVGIAATEANRALRVNGVATVLADGRVLATGGGGGDGNTLASAALPVELWNPVTSEWTIGPSLKNARLYHGTALLLPDARVLVAGGGAPGPLVNRNGELYTPPYLYTGTGALAARPVITQAPTVVNPTQSFAFQADTAAIARVTMVRFGSVSHTWNGDQRHIDLPYRSTGNGGYAVQLPARATDTPPGFYMLFAFDANGVPSVAKTVRINVPGARAADAPVVDALADQTWTSGTVSLRPAGRSPAGRTLSWSAAGLPPGLTIDRGTGAITGTPRSAGSFLVSVAADDGAWTGSATLLWKVSPPTFTLPPPTPPGPSLSGSDVTFTASANGFGITYSWNFGDGTPVTAESATPKVTHRFTAPGLYLVTVTAYDSQRRPLTQSFLQRVTLPLTATAPTRSSMMTLATRSTSGARLWVANPDADTISALDPSTLAKVAEVRVGTRPVTVAEAADGTIWVANRESASISVVNPATASVVATLPLPAGSQPHGIVAAPGGTTLYVALEGTGQLLRFASSTRAQTGTVAVGAAPRHVAVRADEAAVYVSRFVTPALPGENTGRPDPTGRGGEVVRVNAATMAVGGTIVLGHSNRADAENQGRGIPNYLGAMTISPDGSQAFVPSKQDNVMRGTLRDGMPLDFQSTVRAVSSRIVMNSEAEDLPGRLDHDNASVASAAAFDPSGAVLFVALETSREIAVIDAHRRVQMLRVDTGIAPQAVQVSADGRRLYVASFMSRTVMAYDIARLIVEGQPTVTLLATTQSLATEPLSAAVLRGKQLFYDARDTRLARDRYMSCASCHADGGHDGRTWDFTGVGEGLRNTISLRGRGGMRAGPLHWSGNFDEVQDFEGQIRAFAGGTGLMADADFNAGTRSQPMGDAKAGKSADLDALAAYVASLTTVDPSPWRPANGASADAAAGRTAFVAQCAGCHAGPLGTDSAPGGLHEVGTRKAVSGKRLGGLLSGIDTPPLHDAWATAPYLHDGSAPTLAAAIRAHVDGLDAATLAQVTAYVREGARDDTTPARRLNPADLRLAGSALARADGGTMLTAAAGSLAGGAFAAQAWPTAQPFTTGFDFVLDGAARQADGLAFVLQPGGTTRVGGAGGCVGACNLPNAVIASLHTWTNNVAGLAVTSTAGAYPNKALGFDAGAARRIQGRMTIDWNPANRRLSMSIAMLVDGVPRTFADSMTVDLAAKFGATMTAGVTAATGGATSNQSVANWTMTPIAPLPRRTVERIDFGGNAISPPECVSWGEGRVDCFVVGSDGALYQRWRPNGDWNMGYPYLGSNGAGTTWTRLGGTLKGERPSCVSTGANRIDCFAVGTDGALWNLRWNGSGWAWTSLGDGLGSAPSCVARADGSLDCFVLGTDKALWQRGWTGSAWTAWRNWGGNWTSSPSCTVLDDGTPQCFARDAAGAMVQGTPKDGRWQGWTALGGFIQGEPSCVAQSGGRMSCFVRGGDDALWRRDHTGLAWSGWTQEAGSAGLVQAPPRCVARLDRDGIDCLVAAADGTLRHRVRDGGGPEAGAWPWTVAGTGQRTEAPGCVAQRGRLDCAARAAGDGRTLQRAWSID